MQLNKFKKIEIPHLRSMINIQPSPSIISEEEVKELL